MSLSPEVSFELDSFIIDKHTFYWYVILSDGTTVYEDDNRPEFEEKNAWRRLKKYCELNTISIVGFGMVFGSNRRFIETKDWEGVFFIKSILGFIDPKKPKKRYPDRHFYHIGRVNGNHIDVQKFQMPGTIERSPYTRDIGEIENILIIKNVQV
jgi:hypothetical protein